MKSIKITQIFFIFFWHRITQNYSTEIIKKNCSITKKIFKHGSGSTNFCSFYTTHINIQNMIVILDDLTMLLQK